MGWGSIDLAHQRMLELNRAHAHVVDDNRRMHDLLVRCGAFLAENHQHGILLDDINRLTGKDIA